MTHDLFFAIKTGGHRDSKPSGFSCCNGNCNGMLLYYFAS